eukprot:6912050-Alexandrium_andersonii.AAC.1
MLWNCCSGNCRLYASSPDSAPDSSPLSGGSSSGGSLDSQECPPTLVSHECKAIASTSLQEPSKR